jgi:hypothetical protein
MKKISSNQNAPTPVSFTTASVQAKQNHLTNIVPEFIRLPKGGHLEPFTGLSRSKLNELILPSKANGFKPPVRSVSLRKTGQLRGVRLIVLESLLNYLRSKLEDSRSDS